MTNPILKELEPAALTAWSLLIEQRPDLNTDLNKRMFVCGFVSGAPFGFDIAERVIETDQGGRR